MRIKQFLIISLGLLLLLAACQPGQADEPTIPNTPLPTAESNPEAEVPTPELDLGDVTEGEANIDAVDVTVLSASEVEVMFSGSFPDGCTSLGDIETNLEGTVFMVSVMTKRPSEMMCTQALEPFEHTITLDTEGVEPGTYTVQVNDVSQTFEISESTN